MGQQADCVLNGGLATHKICRRREVAKRVIKSEHLHIRIPAELKRAIEREAARLRVRTSDLVRMTLAERCADQREALENGKA